MAATVFDFVSQELEARSDLDKLEARGTVRLALKAGGLDAQAVTSEQMLVVLDKVLPGELASRGVSDAPGVCEALATAMKSADVTGSGDHSPEDVFRRLADH
jgi:hypothetical protein